MDGRVRELLAEVGVPAPPDDEVTIEGHDPVLGNRFPVGEAAAVALAAGGVVISNLWEQQTGRRQKIRVAVRHAALTQRAPLVMRLNGGPPPPGPADGNPVVALYECKDGRWVHLHGAFPHLAAGTLELLGCERDKDAITRAVSQWNGQDLEDALAERRMCGAMARTWAEWQAHPQGQALANVPRVEVLKIGESDPEAVRGGAMPLEGLRVLDLTRILAGPTHARTLASYGADVLYLTSPNLPNAQLWTMDTNHGKLSAYLDLEQAAEQDRLRQLIKEADVFAQGFRAGALERRGFGPEELTRLRPGLIYVSINCYGHVGPWRARPGWEQLAQTVSGLAAAQGTPKRPERMPAAACDYTTGYLAALGTLVALQRRSVEGGSYLVRASLTQSAMWFNRLGATCDPAQASGPGDVSDLVTETQTAWGTLRHLKPAVHLSETEPVWARPPAPLGTHAPVWPAREPALA